MYRKNVKLLSIFNFLIGVSLFAPIAIIYFSRVSGSYLLGTSIFGITMLAAAIFEVPTGIWSDKVGRKYTIVVGSWARLTAFVFYAIGRSYWFLVIGAVMEGLSRSLYSGNNDAFLYDTLAESGVEGEYHTYLGKVSSTEQLALGISAAVGSIIASFSFSYLLWATVFFQVALLIVSYFFSEPRRSIRTESNIFAHLKEAISLFAKNRKLRLLSIASIISYSTSELSFQFRAAFFNLVWPLWAIGFANVISNFGASISFYLSGKIMKRIKAETLILLRSAYGKIVTIIGLVFPTVFSPIIMSSVSILYGVGQVAENHLMQKEFSDHQRATMESLNSLGGDIGFAVMTLVLGGLADAYGPTRALLIITTISISITYIYWMVYKEARHTI